jgi:hypothetical protein
MKPSVQETLISAQQFQNIAKLLLEYTKHEVQFGAKQFLQTQINRLNSNKNDAIAKITTQEGRDRFSKELLEDEAFRYANIFMALFFMNKETRELAEDTIISLSKGEIIEYVEPKNN